LWLAGGKVLMEGNVGIGKKKREMIKRRAIRELFPAHLLKDTLGGHRTTRHSEGRRRKRGGVLLKDGRGLKEGE